MTNRRDQSTIAAFINYTFVGNSRKSRRYSSTLLFQGFLPIFFPNEFRYLQINPNKIRRIFLWKCNEVSLNKTQMKLLIFWSAVRAIFRNFYLISFFVSSFFFFFCSAFEWEAMQTDAIWKIGASNVDRDYSSLYLSAYSPFSIFHSHSHPSLSVDSHLSLFCHWRIRRFCESSLQASSAAACRRFTDTFLRPVQSPRPPLCVSGLTLPRVLFSVARFRWHLPVCSQCDRAQPFPSPFLPLFLISLLLWQSHPLYHSTSHSLSCRWRQQKGGDEIGRGLWEGTDTLTTIGPTWKRKDEKWSWWREEGRREKRTRRNAQQKRAKTSDN